MRPILFAFAVSSFVACATAPTWRGKIVDCKTSAPIADADVQMSVGERAMSGKTSGDGTFSFAAPGAAKDATASVTVTKRGYQATQASLGAAPGGEPVCMSPTR
jgi:hypothetical protein